jgi:hypothetical protein
MKKLLFLLVLSLLGTAPAYDLLGQQLEKKLLVPEVKNAPEPIICYFRTEDMHTAVPLRKELEERMAGRLGQNNGAEIIVDYIGFNTDQRAAFQRAVDIWAGLLESDVPIRIQVVLSSSMASGTLASAGPSSVFRNFDNFQKINAWYGTPLAEKITGEQLNDPDEADIFMQFNATINFYTGLDLNPGSGQYDFVTIALHEIAHGLGFTSFTNVEDFVGSYSFGAPTSYDRSLENGSGENIHDVYSSTGTSFGDQLTGRDLFFRSFSFEGGTLPVIYAPTEYNGGSSISHLDEDTYSSGTTNSLMTPQVGAAEAIHNPGIALKMLEDIGWISMDIDHDALADTEDANAPRVVQAIISGDNAIAENGVNLHYTFSNWSEEVIIPMAATGIPDEFSAEIPAPGDDALVSYYLTAEDTDGRSFTKPGEAPEFFLQYNVGPDTDAPILSHTKVDVVLVDDPIVTIGATVEDNIGVGPLMMTYRINGGLESEIEIPVTFLDLDGGYFSEHELVWDLGPENLTEGDLLEYKLSVMDVSTAGNSSSLPLADGFYEVRVEALLPAQEFYSTNFSDAANDFSGIGFTIEAPAGFSSNALHSNHPYRAGAGADPDDTLVLFQTLKVPIILAENNATIQFDEVVLVEPGESGASFGSDEFWDYVVVEGSTDFGSTWFAFEDGYDSRAQTDWLTKYNSELVTVTIGETQYQDSEAQGDATLFRKREIDMLSSGVFDPGDKVLIRFKIYADQLAAGWGWAIDDLKIQIDEEAPEITHIPLDYVLEGDSQLTLLAKVTDNSVLDSVTFELNLNGQSELISIDEEVDLYELTLNLTDINETSSIKYRIVAVDSATNSNTSFLPETGFFEIPVATLGEVRSMYINDFDDLSNDFISTNYSVIQETGFINGALHSWHPHPNAPTGTALMTALLKYPIELSGSRSWMSFNEIGLVDAISDRLSVEVSKDNGLTWVAVTNSYGSSDDANWTTTFFPKDAVGNSTGIGNPNLYRNRLIDLQNPSEISSGDVVLIRFKMNMNDLKYGWGWAIDDLEIQGPTTSLQESALTELEVYPNPSPNGQIILEGDFIGGSSIISVSDLSGKLLKQEQINISNNYLRETVDLGQLNAGIYLISVRSDSQLFTARIILD